MYFSSLPNWAVSFTIYVCNRFQYNFIYFSISISSSLVALYLADLFVGLNNLKFIYVFVSFSFCLFLNNIFNLSIIHFVHI